MKKIIATLLLLLLSMGISFGAVKSRPKEKYVIAKQGVWLVEVSSGYETVGYQEYFRNLNVGGTLVDIDSSANPSNIVLNGRIEYLFPQQYLLGIKTTSPVLAIKAQEKWWYLGRLPHQTNDLTYGFIFIDLYGGYKLQNNITSSGGLRFYIGDQFRNNFVTTEAIPGLESRETITSVGLLINVKGENQYDINTPCWIYGGEIEGFYSLSINTTNSVLPGVKINGSGGYSMAAMAKVGYHFNKDWNLELQAKYLYVRWNGGSVPQATWPPNDTQALSILLALKSYL